jgi:hypothetical protein
MTQAVAANDDGEFGPDYTAFCLIRAVQDVVDDPEAMSVLVDCQSATEAFLRFTEKMCAVIAEKQMDYQPLKKELAQ